MKYQNRFSKLIITSSFISIFFISCGKQNLPNTQNQNSEVLTANQNNNSIYNGIWREVTENNDQHSTVIEIFEKNVLFCTKKTPENTELNSNADSTQYISEKFKISPINAGSFETISDENNILAKFTISENKTELTMTPADQNAVIRKFILKNEEFDKDFLNNCNTKDNKNEEKNSDKKNPNIKPQDPNQKPNEKPESKPQDPIEKPDIKPDTNLNDGNFIKNIVDIVHKTEAKVKGTDDVGEKILYGLQAAGEVILEVVKGITMIIKWFSNIFS